MTELEAFKSFVAGIDPSWPEELIAEALGEAKGLWAEAALSLNCVRGAVRFGAYSEPEAKAASRPDAKAALANIVAAMTGPQQPIRRI